jgi:anti-sigma factor RsiW
MSCEVVKRGALDAYVHGDLAPGEARAVEAHLFGCHECAAELRRLRAERRLFRTRAEQDTAAVPSFEGVLARIDAAGGEPVRPASPRSPAVPAVVPAAARARSAGKPGSPQAGWTARLAPAGVAVAALAAAAASWVGVSRSPVEIGPGARQDVEDVAIGPDRVCTSEAPVSEEPSASLSTAAPEPRSGTALRVPEEGGLCAAGEGTGAVCGPGSGPAAEACDETVAWCSAGKP